MRFMGRISNRSSRSGNDTNVQRCQSKFRPSKKKCRTLHGAMVNERGQAGAEAVAVGLLFGVIIILLFANVWLVIDTKLRVDDAAREGVRAVVEASPNNMTRSTAESAGSQALADVSRLVGDSRFQLIMPNGSRRCSRATVVVDATVKSINLPLIGRWAPDFHIRGTHSEVVDPYRTGLRGEPICDV